MHDIVNVIAFIDLFSMLSCIAKSRLVHNGGYTKKLLQLFDSPKIL